MADEVQSRVQSAEQEQHLQQQWRQPWASLSHTRPLQQEYQLQLHSHRQPRQQEAIPRQLGLQQQPWRGFSTRPLVNPTMPPALATVITEHAAIRAERPSPPPLEPRPLTFESRRSGAIAIKAGMMQDWDEYGVRVPLTVLWVDECMVSERWAPATPLAQKQAAAGSSTHILPAKGGLLCWHLA